MRHGLSVWLSLFAACACVVPVVTAQPATEPGIDESPRETGPAAHVVFSERSPLSGIEAQNGRYHIPITAMQRYALADASFELYVPEPREGNDKPMGILVWISASDRGTLPRGWREMAQRHRLIAIGANGSGNDKGLAVRIGLALDAVFNLRKQHPIDETRIYASGVSGGGKIAGMLATIYPDVFTGAVCIVGVTYFRDIPVASKPGTLWQRSFERPGNVLLEKARKNSRFVLITGTADFNREPTKDTYEAGFKRDGFAHVDYVEVPGMGHTIPSDVSWIDRAIDTLDAPLALLTTPGARGAATRPAALATTRPVASPGAARSGANPTTAPADPEAEAQQLYSLAENYEKNLLHTQATQRLEKILKDYPTTSVAPRAKAMLERIRAQQR
jgi:predicted esterase